MLSKLVIVPLIMLGLAKAMRLNNEAMSCCRIDCRVAYFYVWHRFRWPISTGSVRLSCLKMLRLVQHLSFRRYLFGNLVLDALDLFPMEYVSCCYAGKSS